MTAPTDPRADARALIERSKLSQDGSLFNWFERCDWCGWTLAESVAKGCVVDNCSQRPMPGLGDWGRQRRLLRALIAALVAALEREVPEVTMPDNETCIAIGKVARDLMTGRIQYDGHIIEATLIWLESIGKIRYADRREETKP